MRSGLAQDWRAREWDVFGQKDPYFGVIAESDFRLNSLDESSRAAFFARGHAEVNETIATLRQFAGPEFRLGRTLDFGCGVGRLTIPLSHVAESVVGVDVAPGMLDEARANADRAGLTNVEFLLSRPQLAGVDGLFDFIHSFIVFQHIPPAIGYGLFDAMLDRLAPGGAGMIHFTYARQASAIRHLAHRARRSSRFLHRMMNLAQGRPMSSPLMAMFEYDIGRILETLQRRRIVRIGGRLTDHGGHLGVMLHFIAGGVS